MIEWCNVDFLVENKDIFYFWKNAECICQPWKTFSILWACSFTSKFSSTLQIYCNAKDKSSTIACVLNVKIFYNHQYLFNLVIGYHWRNYDISSLSYIMHKRKNIIDIFVPCDMAVFAGRVADIRLLENNCPPSKLIHS